MNIDLTNLNILITGSSRGIGYGIARQLAISGARVALHYYKSGKEANELAEFIGNKSYAFKADLSRPDGAIQLFEDVLEEFDHLDVLINNAGVAIHSPVETDDQSWLEEWQKTMAVNLTSVGILCKKAISHFSSQKGGRIINIASRAAFRGDTEDYLAYAASKGGMVSLTRSIARAFGKQGIKAFLVAPGFINTDMAKSFTKIYGTDHALKDSALDKLTEVEDIVPLVVLLASGMADHATGCTIDINAASYIH
jgi:3-oxoacyl-[acyl-carrier protein] reductase